MEKLRIRADELREDEVEYEVELRCGPYGRRSIDEGRQILRNWLRTEHDNDDEYPTNRTMADEYWLVLKALQEIEENLRAGRTARCKSRLIHYYRRLWRCKANYQSESLNKIMLMDQAQNLMVKYFQEDLSALYLPDQQRSDPVESQIEDSSERVQTTSDVTWFPTVPVTIATTARAPEVQTTETVSVASLRPSLTSAPAPNAVVAQPVESQQSSIIDEPFSLLEIETPEAEARRLDLAKRIISQPQPSLDPYRPLADYRNATQTTVNQSRQNAETHVTSSAGHRGNPWNVVAPVLPTTSEQPSTMPPSSTRRSLSPPLSRLANLPLPNINSPWQGPTNSTEVARGSTLFPGPLLTEPGRNVQTDPLYKKTTQQDPNPMDFVHRSEIEDYVKSYVGNFLNQQANRPIVRDTIVNDLARQIANVGLHDQEVSHIDHPGRHVTPVGATDQLPRTNSNWAEGLQPSMGAHSTPTRIDGQRNWMPGSEFPMHNPSLYGCQNRGSSGFSFGTVPRSQPQSYQVQSYQYPLPKHHPPVTSSGNPGLGQVKIHENRAKWPPLESDIEKAATIHRNHVTLTLRNVRSLEKVCADLISGAKKQKLRVKGPMRLHKRIIDLHSPSEIVKQITSINIYSPV
ncbi:hypothetical protein quinque_013959 [Culex quinquefasciatus]